MDFLFNKKRQSGRFFEECKVMAAELEQGKTVAWLSPEEDNSIKKLESLLKDRFDIDIHYEAITRKEPNDPIKHTYDNFGEITGTYIAEQSDVFIGWKITLI